MTIVLQFTRRAKVIVVRTLIRLATCTPSQRSVEQSSAPLASQELVLELVLVLVLVQAASCNLTRAWPTSIPMTPLTVGWCGSSRAGIVAVKDTVDNRITAVVTFLR